MISSFAVRNFKNVNANLSFGKYNILIGPNNSGKTNLINAVSFFADLVSRKPEQGSTAFYDQISRHNWDRMLKFKSPDKTVHFEWVMEVLVTKPYKYCLDIHIGGSASERRDFYIQSEQFSYNKPIRADKERSFVFYDRHREKAEKGYFSMTNEEGRANKLELDIDTNETAFKQIDVLRNEYSAFNKIYFPVFREPMVSMTAYLSRFKCYSSANINLQVLRKPASNKNTNRYLSSDGSDLANILLYMKQQEYESFLQYRKLIAPLFDCNQPVDLNIDPLGSSDVEITVGVGSKLLYLADLSEGTVKAMLLALLLTNRKEPMSILSIDEPEVNLHPAWQARFVSWLLASEASKQFFISTHSPEILDELTDGFMNGEVKVFVLSNHDPIQELKPDRIRDLNNKGFNLGDLYRSKAIEIGGWI